MGKFSVGDRVRVYDRSDVSKAIIKKVFEDGLLLVRNINKETGLECIATYSAHSKQCRKLKKRAARREIWVRPEEWLVSDAGGVIKASMAVSTPTKGWIKFREVKEK